MLTGFALINLARRAIVQGLVRTFVVVELKPFADAPARLDHRAIRLQKNLLIFQAPPQPLDENVVQITAPPIHADPNLSPRQLTNKIRAGELRALISVEYVRLAMPLHRLPQSLDAKFRVHCDRHPPRQNPPAEP